MEKQRRDYGFVVFFFFFTPKANESKKKTIDRFAPGHTTHEIGLYDELPTCAFFVFILHQQLVVLSVPIFYFLCIYIKKDVYYT